MLLHSRTDYPLFETQEGICQAEKFGACKCFSFVFDTSFVLTRLLTISVECFQRRIAGLHQNTAIGSTDITDLWEPLEEGLLP